MKRTIIILTGVLFGFQIAFSQDYSIEFGKITQKEVDLKKYPSDTSASAAVLYDIGNSFFLDSDNGFDVVFERSTKIKIFTKAGFKYAQVEIPFYKEGYTTETVSDIVAYTYNQNNGSLVKSELRKEDIYTEKVSENWLVVKFALPEVREGSIIEYKYRLKSPYKFNLSDWNFQSEIPVSFSKYIVKMVPFYTYTFLLQGASNFSDQKTYESTGLPRNLSSVQYKELIHEYTMKNVPAFRDEEFITSMQDYIIKIDFQLSVINNLDGSKINVISTWPALCNDLLKGEGFGKYLNACEGKASKILEQLNISNLPPQEKLKTIVTYVKANYSWNEENRLFATKTVKEFIDTKTGNSSNINLFLLALLEGAGFEAYPVILSTRDHGKIKSDFPFVNFFNYVVAGAYVDEKLVLLDATEVLLPYFTIPPKCINEKGLIIKKKSEEWLELSNSVPSITENLISVEFNSDLDSVKGSFNFNATRYDALKTTNDKEENMKKFVEDKSYTLLGDITTNNFNYAEKPYQILFSASVPVENINGKIYVSPLFSETYKENPLKSVDRNYPLDMIYTNKSTFRTIIKIPDNYQVTALPKKSEINDDLFSLNYNAEIIDNNVIVVAEYYFKKPVYKAEEYKIIRYYFTELVTKMNQKIVFEKKNL